MIKVSNYKKKKKILFPLVIILFFLYFFKLHIYPYAIYTGGRKYFVLVILSILLLCKGKLFTKTMLFRKELYLYLGLIVLNCLTCFLFRKQSIDISLLGWTPFFFVFFYSGFRRMNLYLFNWEKILRILFVSILVGYIIQYVFIDIYFFDLDKYRGYMEEEKRVRIFSDGILFLGSLFSWNKYLVFGKKSDLWLFVFSFLMIFLQGYRILILSMIIVLVIMFFRIKGFTTKSLGMAVVILMVSAMSLFLPVVQNKVAEMQERSENNELEGESMVRARDLYYAYTSHFNNLFELIGGSGMPVLAVDRDEQTGEAQVTKPLSDYSYEMSNLAVEIHFFTVDLGLIGLSWVAGIPFVLLFIYILISIARMKVEPQYYYLGMYCMLVLFASPTNALSYKHNNVMYLALILIILELAHKQYLSKLHSPKKSNEDRYNHILGLRR